MVTHKWSVGFPYRGKSRLNEHPARAKFSPYLRRVMGKVKEHNGLIEMKDKLF